MLRETISSPEKYCKHERIRFRVLQASIARVLDFEFVGVAVNAFSSGMPSKANFGPRVILMQSER